MTVDVRDRLQAAVDQVRRNNGDPIETGREAALAQWEERWRQLRELLTQAVMPVADHYITWMNHLEDKLPTGKRTDLPHQEVMRRTAELLGFEPDNHHNALKCPYCAPVDRITFQLEPERMDRLFELLTLGLEQGDSVEARDLHDAETLVADLRLQTAGQRAIDEVPQ